MSYQILLQPNGRFSVWSSISEELIATNMQRLETYLFFEEMARKEAWDRVNRQILALEAGNNPYGQFALTIEEARSRSRKQRKGAADGAS